MPIPERQRLASVDPRFRLLVTDDGSLTLEDAATGDTFHSGCGAITECQTVYLQNSGVAERLRQGQPTKVLEVGFGTGLAFLVTAAEADRRGASLHYTSLEHSPLGANCLSQVLRFPSQWQHLEALRDCLLRQWPAVDIQLSPTLHLRLEIMDAAEWRGIPNSMDVVYFDPFSPASAPDLWSDMVLERMFECLTGGGVLVSYCVNSAVRRRLERIGFEVRRAPGPPGGKREVLVAIKK